MRMDSKAWTIIPVSFTIFMCCWPNCKNSLDERNFCSSYESASYPWTVINLSYQYFMFISNSSVFLGKIRLRRYRLATMVIAIGNASTRISFHQKFCFSHSRKIFDEWCLRGNLSLKINFGFEAPTKKARYDGAEGCCHTNFSSNYEKMKWWFLFQGFLLFLYSFGSCKIKNWIVLLVKTGIYALIHMMSHVSLQPIFNFIFTLLIKYGSFDYFLMHATMRISRGAFEQGSSMATS